MRRLNSHQFHLWCIGQYYSTGSASWCQFFIVCSVIRTSSVRSAVKYRTFITGQPKYCNTLQNQVMQSKCNMVQYMPYNICSSACSLPVGVKLILTEVLYDCLVALQYSGTYTAIHCRVVPTAQQVQGLQRRLVSN